MGVTIEITYPQTRQKKIESKTGRSFETLKTHPIILLYRKRYFYLFDLDC